MRKSIIIILLLFISFSCKDNNPLKKSKSPGTLDKINTETKVVPCMTSEKKVFLDLISEMKTTGFKLQKVKNWNLKFKNHLNHNNYNLNDTLLVLPENTIWKGAEHKKEYFNREITNIRFKNTVVTEIVVGKNTVMSLNDIKIVQFLFTGKEEARKSTEKLRLISYYTIKTDGLKNPNCWWVHDCAIYFCRAFSASTSFKLVIEAFENKHGKVKIMRW